VEGTEEDGTVAGELPDGAGREGGEVPSQQTGEEKNAENPFSCSQCDYSCNRTHILSYM